MLAIIVLFYVGLHLVIHHLVHLDKLGVKEPLDSMPKGSTIGDLFSTCFGMPFYQQVWKNSQK
jgi:predicted tellurium resistance membrane protein TerC